MLKGDLRREEDVTACLDPRLPFLLSSVKTVRPSDAEATFSVRSGFLPRLLVVTFSLRSGFPPRLLVGTFLPRSGSLASEPQEEG